MEEQNQTQNEIIPGEDLLYLFKYDEVPIIAEQEHCSEFQDVLQNEQVQINDNISKEINSQFQIDIYSDYQEQWTTDHFDAISQLQVESNQAILQFFFYFPIPEQKMEYLLFQSKEKEQLIINILLSQNINEFVNNKLCSSLLIPYFENSNGFIIYQQIAKIIHLPESQLKHQYQLNNEQIRALKLNIDKSIEPLRKIIIDNWQFIENLKNVVNKQKDQLQNIDVDNKINFDDYEKVISCLLKTYSHKLDVSQDSKEQQQQQRLSSLQEEKKIEKAQLRDMLKSIGESDYDSDEEVMFRKYNQKQGYLSVSDFLNQSQNMKKQKQKQEQLNDFAYKPVKRRKKPKQTFFSKDKFKATDKYSHQKVQLTSKQKWGSILQYTQDNSFKEIATKKSQFQYDTHRNKTVVLDSLFFNTQKNISINDSSFRKQKVIKAHQIFKNIKEFNYQQQIKKFVEDTHFRSYINHHMAKIQKSINMNIPNQQNLENLDTIQINDVKYQLNQEDSIQQIFTHYKKSLKQVIIDMKYANYEQLQLQFNLFWHLIKKQAQQLQISAIMELIKKEMLQLLQDFSIREFMKIKHFDYQIIILMQVFLIVDVINQVKNNNDQDLQDFLEYSLCWILQTSIDISIDMQRGLLQKKLRDILILLQLLGNVLHNRYSQSLSQCMLIIYDSILNTKNDRNNFQNWKMNKQVNILLDKEYKQKGIEISLYLYQMTLFLCDINQKMFGTQYKPEIDWRTIEKLLKSYQEKSLSPFSNQLLTQISQIENTFQNSLNQEMFIQLFQLFINKGSCQNNKQPRKDEILSQIKNLYSDAKQQNKEFSNFEISFLVQYLQSQDQKVLKQLYSKLIPIIQNKYIAFQVQVTFCQALDNLQQSFIIFKKCIQILQELQNNEQENCIEIARMVAQVVYLLQKFINNEQYPQMIENCITLLETHLDKYNSNVLKLKGKLSSNEFLLKNEQYLSSIFIIFYSINLYLQKQKQKLTKLIFYRGKWQNCEFKWLNSSLMEKLFNIYLSLLIKPAELEQIYVHYTKCLSYILHKRIYSRQFTPRSQPEIFSQNDNDIEMEECCDELLQECLAYEEQDSQLYQYLTQYNIRNQIENFTQSYLKYGKDMKVLVNLFKLNGKLDGILIENKELKSYQIVSKVQAQRYGQISDNFQNDSKPMFIANLICCYLKELYFKCGISFVCGLQTLTNKLDLTQKGLIIQFNYHMLENLVRGLLMKEQKSYSLKLYHILQDQGVSDCIFNDQIETEIFSIFLSCDKTTEHNHYQIAQSIFSQFFQNGSAKYNSDKHQTNLIADIVYKYVALIPLLCKQQSQKQMERDEYLEFLKTIMLSFMVNFQSISHLHHNLSILIGDIIEIVIPTFFNTNKQIIISDISLQQQLPNDAFYFYQYLSLSYQINPYSKMTKQNMNQLLQLLVQTVEANLNTLIPKIFFQQNESITDTIKFIKEENIVLKQLLDKLNLCKDESNKIFLNALLNEGLDYLNISTQYQDTIKIQRKLLSLLILFVMILVRDKSQISVMKTFHKLTQLMISQAIKDERLQWKYIDSNLNLLALLTSYKIIKKLYKNVLQMKDIENFISFLLSAIAHYYIGQQMMKDSVNIGRLVNAQINIAQKYHLMTENQQHLFLVKSYHQFLINDTKLVNNLIIQYAFDIIRKEILDENVSVLLNTLQIGCINCEQEGDYVFKQFKEGLTSLVQISIKEDEYQSSNFKSITNMYI